MKRTAVFPTPNPNPQPRTCDSTRSQGIFKTVLTRVLTMDAYGLANADAVLPGVKAGDPAAQEALYRAFEAPVYNLARRICRTTEDAEDVMQETFFEVFRSIGRFRGDGSLWGWVRTIASSKALMRLRRNKYRDTEELQDDVTPLRREDAALRMDLETALERLSETSRAVVWLHDVEGYTHEEIAGMMDRTVSFSKSQLARAHSRLRRWLQEEVPA
jgi:RNA polymerase sigma factor (sigma-70 family)